MDSNSPKTIRFNTKTPRKPPCPFLRCSIPKMLLKKLKDRHQSTFLNLSKGLIKVGDASHAVNLTPSSGSLIYQISGDGNLAQIFGKKFAEIKIGRMLPTTTVDVIASKNKPSQPEKTKDNSLLERNQQTNLSQVLNRDNTDTTQALCGNDVIPPVNAVAPKSIASQSKRISDIVEECSRPAKAPRLTKNASVSQASRGEALCRPAVSSSSKKIISQLKKMNSSAGVVCKQSSVLPHQPKPPRGKTHPVLKAPTFKAPKMPNASSRPATTMPSNLRKVFNQNKQCQSILSIESKIQQAPKPPTIPRKKAATKRKLCGITISTRSHPEKALTLPANSPSIPLTNQIYVGTKTVNPNTHQSLTTKTQVLPNNPIPVLLSGVTPVNPNSKDHNVIRPLSARVPVARTAKPSPLTSAVSVGASSTLQNRSHSIHTKALVPPTNADADNSTDRISKNLSEVDYNQSRPSTLDTEASATSMTTAISVGAKVIQLNPPQSFSTKPAALPITNIKLSSLAALAEANLLHSKRARSVDANYSIPLTDTTTLSFAGEASVNTEAHDFGKIYKRYKQFHRTIQKRTDVLSNVRTRLASAQNLEERRAILQEVAHILSPQGARKTRMLVQRYNELHAEIQNSRRP